MLAGRRGPHARQHHEMYGPYARHSVICDILNSISFIPYFVFYKSK